MKYILLFVFSIPAFTLAYSQSKWRCSWDGITVPPIEVAARTPFEEEMDELIADIVDEILDEIGLHFDNFYYHGASNVRNFQAEYDRNSKTLDIYYSYTFLRNLYNRLGDEEEFSYAVGIILLHEFGHHLNGHVYGGGGNPDLELQADYFAGKWAGRGELDFSSSVRVYKLCTSVGATNTHPGRDERIEAFQEGYDSW